MKTYIETNYILNKEEGITHEEADKFIDEFIALVEKYNMICAGSYQLLDEKHFDKEE